MTAIIKKEIDSVGDLKEVIKHLDDGIKVGLLLNSGVIGIKMRLDLYVGWIEFYKDDGEGDKSIFL